MFWLCFSNECSRAIYTWVSHVLLLLIPYECFMVFKIITGGIWCGSRHTSQSNRDAFFSPKKTFSSWGLLIIVNMHVSISNMTAVWKDFWLANKEHFNDLHMHRLCTFMVCPYINYCIMTLLWHDSSVN